MKDKRELMFAGLLGIRHSPGSTILVICYPWDLYKVGVSISILRMSKEAQRVKKLTQNLFTYHKVGSSRTGFKFISIRSRSLYSCLLFYQMDSTSQCVCFVWGIWVFGFRCGFCCYRFTCIVFVFGWEGWWQWVAVVALAVPKRMGPPQAISSAFIPKMGTTPISWRPS